jgi:hypothetical protein
MNLVQLGGTRLPCERKKLLVDSDCSLYIRPCSLILMHFADSITQTYT